MDILWHGQACFEIRIPSNQAEKKTIVIDPFSPDYGLKLPPLTAEILLISHDHADHSNVKAVKGKPFLIDGPGEYEVKSVFIRGISGSHGSFQKKELGKITIYTLEIEGVRLCHLSDLGQKELSPEQIEAIGEVDILMVPVGGSYTIDGEGAQKVVNQIEPKIVIPMHYKLSKLKVKLDGVETFLKAMGQEEIEPQSVLKIKKQGLPAETKIVVLKLCTRTSSVQGKP
jgi:L-ascorbate metabolism protein UlaG (beta-lactamase superfamily)